MLRKNRIGAIFLLMSLVFLLIPGSFSITGNVIGEDFELYFSPMYVLSLILFIFSFIVFVSRQSLDAIIIPTGSHEQDIERADKGAREKGKLKDKGYFVISGHVAKGKSGKREYKGTQTQDIYRELRRYGVKPKDMTIEPQARSTIENVVYSLEKIKKRGGRDVGIVSYPGHLDRFEDIIKKGKEEGVIDRNLEVHRIPTRYKETTREKVYESLSRILNRYKLRHGVEEALKAEDDPVVKFAKRVKGHIVDLFPGKNQ